MSKYLQKYCDEHSRFMVINGSMVHYRDEGEGPVVLLIHGAFSSLHTFDGWVAELKHQFRLIRLDLPGFGLSGSNEDHHYSVDRYVRFIDIFVKRMDIDRFALAGSSLGGWLSWEYALRFPKKPERLILIDSAGFLEERNVPLPFKMARTPFVSRIARYAIKRNVLEVFVKQVYADSSKVTPELIDRYYDLFTREGNAEAFFALVNSKFKDNTPKLPKIKIPTLILWGELDQWLDVENGYRFLEAIPDAHMVIYEHLGHIPMEEDPRLTSMDIRAFLQGKDVGLVADHEHH